VGESNCARTNLWRWCLRGGAVIESLADQLTGSVSRMICRGALALPRPVGTRGWTRGWTSPFPRYFGVKTVKTIENPGNPGFLVGQCRPFSSTDTGSHWASPGMLGEIPRIDSSLAQEALCPQMSSVQWCPLLDFGDDDYTWLVGDDDYIQWEIVGKPWEKHRKIWENTSGWWWWFMILIFVL